MDRYRVPKFIEKKPKIIGPMTFRQFSYIGVAGILGIILWFSVSIIPFLLGSIFLLAVAMTLAFVKVGRKTLPEMIIHSLSFLFSSKIYLWKRKKSTPKVIKREKQKAQKKETNQSPLRMTQKSRLKEMETKVKTGKK